MNRCNREHEEGHFIQKENRNMQISQNSLRTKWVAKSVCIAFSYLLLNAGLAAAIETPVKEAEIFRLLTGQRVILGTVEEIRSQEIRVHIGNVMPRFLSLKQAEDKYQMSPRVGDLLVLVINDQNNVIEHHVYGEDKWHYLIHGKLLKTIPEDQTWALIQDPSGKARITSIDEEAREKIAALPLGKDARFLLDASSSIIDVSWKSATAAISYP